MIYLNALKSQMGANKKRQMSTDENTVCAKPLKTSVPISNMKGADMDKKNILIIGLFGLIWTVALQAGETKVSGEVWNRYMMQQKESKTTLSQLSVDRGYLALEPVLSDKIKGRFTLLLLSQDVK